MSDWPASLLRGRPEGEPMVLRSYVDGAFRTPAATFDKRSPVTGEVALRVAETDRGTLDEAVAAARRAQAGEWGSMGEQARATILRRLADEPGPTRRRPGHGRDRRHRQVGRAGPHPRRAAGRRQPARLRRCHCGAGHRVILHPSPRRGSGDERRHPQARRCRRDHRPLEPSLLLATWKIAPALACGNAVIVKPSEETLRSVTVLAEAFGGGGLPRASSTWYVHGHGPNAVGEVADHPPRIDVVTSTGESATVGSAIQKAAADTVKAVSFELGGKNAGLVFADADLDAAVAAASGRPSPP